MKKVFSIFLAIAIAFSLAACGQWASSSPPSEVDPESAGSPSGAQVESQAPLEETTDRNILVAYFSWADNAALAEDVDAITSPSVVPPRDVQQLADWVQKETGGDLFPIRVTVPYPSDWDACLERANEERGSDARPELQEHVNDLAQYDTVFLGYPKMEQGYICV